MRLTLGDTSYDLATRCLVLGMDEGADVIEVEPTAAGLARARELARAGAPVAVATTNPAVAVAALDAGAVLIAGAPPGALEAAAKAGAAVVVATDAVAGEGLSARREALVRRAHAAEECGIPPDRIIVDPGLADSPELLRQARRFAELGYPLLVTHSAPAAIALAVTGGCRLVRTRDVRGARRVCDVLAAILEAHT